MHFFCSRVVWFPLIFIGVIFLFSAKPTMAATRTWDGGGGADTNWSTDANWSSDTEPVSGDTVVFDNTSDNNSTIDASFTGTVTTITINSGYDGTITMARSFTTTTFTQASGNFTAANQTLDINGAFTLSAGTFTASSGTATFANSITISGSSIFNHNSGTVTFDGTASVTLSCNNVSFNTVSFAHTSGTKTVSSNCTLPLGNNPTVGSTSGSVTLAGTMSGSGTLTTTGTFTLNSGAVLSGFSGIVSSGFTIAGATLDLGSYSTVDINSGFTLSSGTFTAPSGTMTIAGALTISGSPIFNHNNGTISLDGSTATLACNNITFNLINFIHTGAVKTVGSDCNLPIGNNPQLGTSSASVTLNGTLTGTGTLTAVGTFTLNSGATLTGFSGLVTASFTVAGATLNLNSYTTVDINTNFTLSSGTFTAPSGVMTVGSSFTISGSPTFNHNSGTITFDGTATSTLSCNDITFNAVVFAHTGATKTINSNCNLPLGNNPALGSSSASVTLNGTLTGSGTLTAVSTLTLNSSAVLSGFSGINAVSLTVAGATMDFSGYSAYSTTTTTTVSSGSLTLPAGADLSALTISGGTFTAPSGTMTIAGALTISGSPTFNHNSGTITFDGASNVTLSCNNVTFNSVILAHTAGTKTISSNCTFPLGSNPTSGTGSGGSLNLSGTLTGSGLFTMNGSSPLLTLSAGASFSGFSGLLARSMTISGATVDFSSYTSFTVNSVFTLSSGSITLPNGADFNSSITISGGTFNAPSGSMTWAGALTVSGSPTFNHNSGTIQLDGAGGSLTCNNIAFNLVLIGPVTSGVTVGSSCNLPLGNNPTSQTSGSSTLTVNGTLSGTGTLTVANTFVLNSGATLSGFNGLVTNGNTTYSGATINFGSYTTFDVNGTFTLSSGTLTMPSGTATFASTFTISGSPTFNHNSGIITFDGSSTVTLSCNNVSFNTVTFAHTSGTKTVSSNCSMPLGTNPTSNRAITLNGTFSGSGTLSVLNTFILNSGSTITGFNAIYAGNLQPAGANLDLSSYTSVTTTGGFNLSAGTFTAPPLMTIGGNWTITGGIFNHNNGTVTLNGTYQTLSGSTTFYNLTKIITSTDTLTFTEGTTTTVLNTLILQGTAGAELSLRSSTTGTQWNIDPQGTRSMQYLNVQDSNNINTTALNAGVGSVDANNNTNWSFDSTTPTPTPTVIGTASAFSIFGLDTPTHESYTSNERLSFKWKAEDENISSYSFSIDNGDTGDFTINGIPARRTTDYETSRYIVRYENFEDSDSTNNTITIHTKSSNDWDSANNDGKLKEGKRTWTVIATDTAGNTKVLSRILYVDTTAPQIALPILSQMKTNPTSTSIKSSGNSIEITPITKQATPPIPENKKKIDTKGVRDLTGNISQTRKRVWTFGKNVFSEVFSSIRQPSKLLHIPAILSDTVFDSQHTRIMNVTINERGKDYVIITWQTSNYTFNNKINYGTSQSFGHEAFAKDWQKEHMIKLTGLTPGTQYHFEVMGQSYKSYVFDATFKFRTTRK